MINRLFIDHPASVNETYFQHLCSALSFTATMLVAAAACLVHAFLPFLCLKTGSRLITGLHDRMVTHRVRPAPMQRETSEARA
jgi:hypothetical protein